MHTQGQDREGGGRGTRTGHRRAGGRPRRIRPQQTPLHLLPQTVHLPRYVMLIYIRIYFIESFQLHANIIFVVF